MPYYRQNLKRIIQDAQRHQAQIDVAFGRSPRKSSKTYIEAYAQAYAEQEILSGRGYN